DPTHERARQAMKSAAPPTSPNAVAPHAPIPNSTQPVVPPGLFRSAETPPPQPPGLSRKTSAGGFASPFASTPSAPERKTSSGLVSSPFASTPSAERRPASGLVASPYGSSPSAIERHFANTAPASLNSTMMDPRPVGSDPSLAKSWSLEVLTGPHAGTSVPLAKRALVIGRGLGVIDVDEDPFMSAGHASFFQRNNELWVSDGGSASGTWVSFEGPQRLNTSDSFSVGLQRLKYLGPLETAPVDSPWPYGAPRPAASWRLEHVLLGNRACRTWVMRGVVTIGRHGCQLNFEEDESLEEFHAELRPAGAAIELVDRSKTRSTFVALPSATERRLLENTRVRLGSTLFRVTAR
ncbi:MAG: FHA domain-containing protein, partial [Archangium sp.]